MSVFFLSKDERVTIEKLLETLVRVVYAELLEAVYVEDFEAPISRTPMNVALLEVLY